MEFLIFILCVISVTVTPITISSNGNSPEVKLIHGIVVDSEKGFAPMTVKEEVSTAKNVIEKREKPGANATMLSINERYRRLIPYMTFYYANDLVTPTGEAYPRVKEIEVEKAQILNAKELDPSSQRQPKKIIYPIHRNVPRYQGNRLTHYNIASANPTKLFYKEYTPVPQHQASSKFVTNYNPFLSDALLNNNYNSGRLAQRPIVKVPSAPFSLPNRKPYVNLYQNDASSNTRYYMPEKEQAPKYKLVPYEQTPPVKVAPQTENFYEVKKPIAVPVMVPQEVYIKPRPARPHYYESDSVQKVKNQPTVVSEDYYENQRPHQPPRLPAEPVIESGFMPITDFPRNPTEAPVYSSPTSEKYNPDFENQKHVVRIETENEAPVSHYNPNYYEYVEQPTYKPPQFAYNGINIAALLNSLQRNKSIPKPITRANVGTSIKTLLHVLNALKAVQQDDADIPILSTPKPFIAPKLVLGKTIVKVTPKPVDDDPDIQEEAYLAPENLPSQHLDDLADDGGSSQRFPLPVVSDDEGGTPGKPDADYPILTTIPQTSFDCKSQRYKGFFADTETRCQVWHYCDLNGGQASFLCPNGTIFSQAGLTCDWWFNVKCSNTPQLYVLNESLYKFILPHSPKFPEDYSGPLVDKYLTLKFKEMEEEFKKNKSKQAKDKMDSGDDDSKGESEESKESEEDKDDGTGLSVMVGSPGTSGNVERLQDNL